MVIEITKKKFILYCIVQFVYTVLKPPKPRLTASKILSPGCRLFKPLSRLSTAYGYPILAQLGLRLQAEPLTSLANADQRRLTQANKSLCMPTKAPESQRRPVRTNGSQHRPTKASIGQRGPTKLDESQCGPMKVNTGQQEFMKVSEGRLEQSQLTLCKTFFTFI